MMAIAIAIVLAFLSLAFVLYPLYRQASDSTADQPVAAQKLRPRDVQTLEKSEQTARNAIQEVELDYQLGNIAEPDYRSLRERYMQRAMVALKSRYEQEQEIDEEIEEQLRKLKESKEFQASKEVREAKELKESHENSND
jgi:ABC-type transporter lipoprotein component MlaA